MVFMAHLAQLLNKIFKLVQLPFLLMAVVMVSCNTTIQQQKLIAFNADSIKTELRNGLIYDGASLFTGRLFKLSNNHDTLFVQDIVDGLKNGYCKFFYEGARLAEIRYFEEGKREGAAFGWWPDGKKKFEYHYQNDLFVNQQQEWFSNGQRYSCKIFLNGYENGMQQVWDSTGAILSNYEAINGRNYGNIGQKHCKSIFENDSFVVRN